MDAQTDTVLLDPINAVPRPHRWRNATQRRLTIGPDDVFVPAVKWLDLAAVFVLEMCALVALGYWGVESGGGPVGKAALGMGAPVAMAVVWGTFAAPRARVRLRPAATLILKTLVFAIAALALAVAGQPRLGVALFVSFCVAQGLAAALGV